MMTDLLRIGGNTINVPNFGQSAVDTLQLTLCKISVMSMALLMI